MDEVDVVAAAEARTRQRVAQVLHDDLQQHLHSLRVRVGMVESMLARGEGIDPAAVADLGRRTDAALDVLRSATTELAVPTPERDLATTLSHIVTTMADLHGLQVDVHHQTPAAALSPDVVAALSNATRELLFNVVKHAGVDHADVYVTAENGAVAVSVVDAGNSSPAEADAPTGLGIDALRHRLSQFGGSLDVGAAVSGGTRAVVSIPDGSL